MRCLERIKGRKGILRVVDVPNGLPWGARKGIQVTSLTSNKGYKIYQELEININLKQNRKQLHEFCIIHVMVKHNLCTNIMYKVCVNYAMILC